MHKRVEGRKSKIRSGNKHKLSIFSLSFGCNWFSSPIILLLAPPDFCFYIIYREFLIAKSAGILLIFASNIRRKVDLEDGGEPNLALCSSVSIRNR
jgi:hypothetical protein